MQDDKIKVILSTLLVIVIIYYSYKYIVSKTDNFVGETTTVPTTTKPTTTIPITTQGLDQSKYLVYNENQYKQAINESTKVNNNIDNINDKINLINQVATMDANYQYNDNEIKKELNQKFLDNIDTIVNKQLQESSDFNKNDPEIKKLKEQITDLENIIQAMGIRKKKQTTYNQIKSINNGQEFCLINTDYNDNITKDVKKGYQIQMNNGCLSVGQNDYTVNKCDSKNPKQQFKMVHILNDLMYSNNIDKLLPFATPDKTKTNYPFVIMKSLNNDNCVTNNHGQVTVQPCSILTSQQFIPLESN